MITLKVASHLFLQIHPITSQLVSSPVFVGHRASQSVADSI